MNLDPSVVTRYCVLGLETPGDLTLVSYSLGFLAVSTSEMRLTCQHVPCALWFLHKFFALRLDVSSFNAIAQKVSHVI